MTAEEREFFSNLKKVFEVVPEGEEFDFVYSLIDVCEQDKITPEVKDALDKAYKNFKEMYKGTNTPIQLVKRNDIYVVKLVELDLLYSNNLNVAKHLYIFFNNFQIYSMVSKDATRFINGFIKSLEKSKTSGLYNDGIAYLNHLIESKPIYNIDDDAVDAVDADIEV